MKINHGLKFVFTLVESPQAAHWRAPAKPHCRLLHPIWEDPESLACCQHCQRPLISISLSLKGTQPSIIPTMITSSAELVSPCALPTRSRQSYSSLSQPPAPVCIPVCRFCSLYKPRTPLALAFSHWVFNAGGTLSSGCVCFFSCLSPLFTVHHFCYGSHRFRIGLIKSGRPLSAPVPATYNPQKTPLRPTITQLSL
jgi:hypothetical protein